MLIAIVGKNIESGTAARRRKSLPPLKKITHSKEHAMSSADDKGSVSSAAREAFITGSYAYGTPTESSDIDLVVWVGSEAKDILARGGYPVRFGKLNLILVDNDEQWAAWSAGTRALKKLAPVARDFAVAFFIELGVIQEFEPSKSKAQLIAEGEMESRYGSL